MSSFGMEVNLKFLSKESSFCGENRGTQRFYTFFIKTENFSKNIIIIQYKMEFSKNHIMWLAFCFDDDDAVRGLSTFQVIFLRLLSFILLPLFSLPETGSSPNYNKINISQSTNTTF